MRPRLGFLGVGWIGFDRMKAIHAAGVADLVAVFDPSDECATAARTLNPDIKRVASFEDMLEQRLDGVVIATPSAMHADQSISVLSSGAAVFCQKPLGRSARETAAVVEAAKKADLLLGADFSYRRMKTVEAVRPLLQEGALGSIFAADLAFHNVYGPDKPWFYEKALAGGGCLMDLGIHLVDLLLHLLDWPEVIQVSARTYRQGRRLGADSDEVEDFAAATLQLDSGLTANLSCSWNSHLGRDAVIRAGFFGPDGGVAVENVAGSFYDFEAFHFQGTQREKLAAYPDSWGGRSAADWAKQLAGGHRFDPRAEEYTIVSEILDRLYASAGSDGPR